jgi:hypothetical protein
MYLKIGCLKTSAISREKRDGKLKIQRADNSTTFSLKVINENDHQEI